ncbi:MAG: endonuclease MutS2, partial [Candidatus Caldatribacteriaceae bacterium]
ELELLKIKEKEEIENIIYQLTSSLRPYLDDISLSFRIFIQLDFLRAKVKLGETWEGIIPQVGGEDLIIREGKHPLLFKKAVPFDLSLSPSRKILVVSGPNAGGKTVLLKSIALIVSLAFCGIPIPVKPDSRIPFYEDIFVDIGDHQDIENELSTFTSRTRNLAEAVQQNCSRTLFLIDELGAGTDPNEGTALAMAILKHLRQKGATCVVTTHLPLVKYRASQEEGMGVASLTINPDTFEPTYRLVSGEIGASYGIRIAERVGLPKEIVEESLRLLGKKEIQLNDLLITLTKEKSRLIQIVAENNLRTKELEKKEREIEKRIKDLEKKEKTLLKEFKQELEQYLFQTKDEVSRMVGKLRKENQLNQEEYELWKKRIKYEEDKLQKIEETITEPCGGREESFQEGDTVLIDFLNEKGTIVTLEEKKKNALVDIGGRKVKVSVTALRKVKDQEPLSLSSHFPNFVTPLLKNEIEIRSLKKDEALEKLDQYFDKVVLAGFTTIYIIHGKGEGILREMTHEFLKKHPQVKSFRLGYPGEGGLGVTVVTLKS